MNVFLPYENYEASIKSLDKKRCMKQAVECKQLIDGLDGIGSLSWKKHPASKMYVNYTDSLKLYYNICLNHCINHWKIKFTKLLPYNLPEKITHPKWLGFPKFHSIMRANLLRKSPEWYKMHGWSEQPTEGYLWPVEKSGLLNDEVFAWIKLNEQKGNGYIT